MKEDTAPQVERWRNEKIEGEKGQKRAQDSAHNASTMDLNKAA